MDRLLALLLGRRYRQITTLGREYLVHSYRSLGLSRYWQYRNFLFIFDGCKITWLLRIIAPTFCYCFTFSSTCGTTKLEFITIFRSNRHNQYHLIHPERERQCLYKRPVAAVGLNVVLFAECVWCPLSRIEDWVVNNKSPTFYFVLYATITLMCLSLTLNQFLYCSFASAILHHVTEFVSQSEGNGKHLFRES